MWMTSLAWSAVAGISGVIRASGEGQLQCKADWNPPVARNTAVTRTC